MNDKKGALKGTTTRAYDAIAESMDLYKTMMEITHNSFEHGGSRGVTFSFTEKNGKPFIRIKDNGHAMSNEIFKKFVSEYHCHDISESCPLDGTYISMKGYGLKDAIIYLCNPNGESKVTITNYLGDYHKTSWNWKVNRRDADNGDYDNEIVESFYKEEEASEGLEITISNACPFTEIDTKNAMNRVSRSYSSELITKGRTVRIDDNYSVLVDPLHLSEFPFEGDETIRDCKPGIYTNNEIIWSVEDIKVSGLDEDGKSRKKINIRTVEVYLNGNPYNKLHKDDPASSPSAGIYPMLGPTYLEQGGNWELHFGGSDNGGGGSVRNRLGIIITEENKFLWGIKAFKTNGLKPFCANSLLVKNFKVVSDKNSYIPSDITITLFEYLKKRFKLASEFHKEVKTYRDGINDNKDLAIKDFTEVSQNYWTGTKGKKTESQITTVTFIHDERQSYAITSKESPIKKVLDEDGDNWQYEIVNNNVGDGFNSRSKEELLYLFSEVAEEVGMSPDHYGKMFNLLGKKLS